jgi:DNA topoisomerase-3
VTTLILAEKPSVARDIARVLGVHTRREGYLEGNGYRITWAFGHLVHFAEPDDYGPEWAGRWSFAQLPMIPQHWRLRTDKKTAEQFSIVKTLLNAPETKRVICATDAGREGEAIFRLIYEHARCTKPVERLWISSLTDEAIRAGFQALKPSTAFDALAAAARARAQADWLIGMNLTRAYTVRNHRLCTIGRVQTPTLAMIVARDATIAAFEKAYFYELVAHLREGFDARFSRDGETRIDDKAEAEALHEQLRPQRSGRVTEIHRKERRQRPPPLYDLTNLQRDANRHFGFTAAKTLELAQQLYEQYKLISYPRTESRHISEDMLPQLPGILNALVHPLAPQAAARLAAGHQLSKAYVDQTRLTDHHAILPTQTRVPAGLAKPLRQLYDLVCARFVAVFLPDQRMLDIQVKLDIGGACFVAQAMRVLEAGWKDAELKTARAAAEAETESPEVAALLALEQDQIVHIEGLEVVEKETQAPRPYNDATLLNAMKNAGREIEDETLAAAINNSGGLGTPATRAGIIEKLLRTGYIERQRKQLRATEKGRTLARLVAEPLRSPELTADWEQRLKAIEQGEAQAEQFYQDIRAFLSQLLPQVIKATTPPAGIARCPKCQQGLIIRGRRDYGCNRYREGCDLVIRREQFGIALDASQIRRLIEQGQSEPLENLHLPDGQRVRARLRLRADFTLEPVFCLETPG